MQNMRSDSGQSRTGRIALCSAATITGRDETRLALRGNQSGAKANAEHNKIDLLIVREQNDAD